MKTITIQTVHGPEEIVVERVYGCLAVHPTLVWSAKNGRAVTHNWTLTHIPTGLSLLQLGKYRDTVRLAKDILATGIPLEELTTKNKSEEKYRPVVELLAALKEQKSA